MGYTLIAAIADKPAQHPLGDQVQLLLCACIQTDLAAQPQEADFSATNPCMVPLLLSFTLFLCLTQ